MKNNIFPKNFYCC